MNVYQTVTIASIVQAEAATAADMGKVARVVYNRLARGMPLQMDSTINYALNRRTLDTTPTDTKLDSPYNTYQRMGLPPTPIANPGEEAMRAAVNPTPGRLAVLRHGQARATPASPPSYEEHQSNVAEFNRQPARPRSPPTASRRHALAGGRLRPRRRRRRRVRRRRPVLAPPAAA